MKLISSHGIQWFHIPKLVYFGIYIFHLHKFHLHFFSVRRCSFRFLSINKYPHTPQRSVSSDLNFCFAHRKEKRLAGTKKLLRTLDFGTEMATEALDDDLEKYERDTRVCLCVQLQLWCLVNLCVFFVERMCVVSVFCTAFLMNNF